jgi:hypothetical protein
VKPGDSSRYGPLTKDRYQSGFRGALYAALCFVAEP